MSSAECSRCATALDTGETVCSACGAADRRVIVSDSARLYEAAKLETRPTGRATGDFIRQTIAGDDLHRKSGKWNKKVRTIDRENDEYQELVTDGETGQVIIEQHERLSEHRDHGSARKHRQGL